MNSLISKLNSYFNFNFHFYDSLFVSSLVDFVSSNRLFISILLSLTVCILYYQHNKSQYWPRLGLPGKKYPFFDLSIDLFLKPVFQINHLEYLQFGPVWGYFRGHAPALMITQPELIQRILVQNAHLFINRPEFSTGNRVLDSMLFVARDNQWRRIRVVVTPTFTGLKLRRMRSLIDECVKSALKRLKPYVRERKEINLKDYWGLFTTDNISKCFFATDLHLDDVEQRKESSDTEVEEEEESKLNLKPEHNQKTSLTKSASKESEKERKQKEQHKKERDQFLTYMKSMIDVPIFALIFYIHLPKVLQRWLGLAFFPSASVDYFHNLLLRIVKVRSENIHSHNNDFLQYLIDRSELCKKPIQPVECLPDEFDEDSSLANLLQMQTDNEEVSNLLHRHVRLTESEVIGQCLIILIGGYDTTSTLLSWITYRLALDPHIQEKLYREIVECRRQLRLNSKESIPFESFQSLEYMSAVINETLRFYPPFTMVERVAQQDFPIPELNLIVPKGMEIGIPLYTLHHMHKHFPQPELFLPERFLSEEYLEKHFEEHAGIDAQMMPSRALKNGMVGPFGVDKWFNYDYVKRTFECLPDDSATSVLPDFRSAIEAVRHLNANHIVPYTFLPFGAGMRSCVGKRFALLNVKVILAELLIRYKFVPSKSTRYPPRYKVSVSFTHSKDLLVAVKPRKSHRKSL